jgi:hypothetical protein
MTTDLGIGLRVQHGDISLEDGDLAMVAGPANLAQALELRVLTPLGSDRYDVRYGLDAKAIFTGPGGAGEVRDLLRLNLAMTLGSDPRVGELRELDVTEAGPPFADRVWRAQVSIRTTGDQPVAVTLNVGGAR